MATFKCTKCGFDKETRNPKSAPHPTEEKHYIEWMEIVADGKAYRQFLNPGDLREATVHITADEVTVREYCNLHGLWKA